LPGPGTKQKDGGLATTLVFVLAMSMMICGFAAAVPSDPSKKVPVFAGFAEIDPRKTSFILVGDTQTTSHWEFWREKNNPERKLILDEIARRAPAFVIHLGDLTTRGSSKKHWQEFDDLHRAWREKKTPYFPILGNHDLYGNDEEALGHYFGRFPHLDRRRWYSFKWRNVGFLMVDSNFTALTEGQHELQVQWYWDELERFDREEGIDYIIVCCHEPPFTNSRVVAPNQMSKAYFADPFGRSRKTCLFFSGHSHTYERLQMEGKFFIVSGGGGGPRHKVSTDPKNRPYNDLFPGPELRFLHFCEVEMHDKVLTYRILRLEPNRTFTVVDPLAISRK
jgi:predicted phosphodiesterase